MKHPWMVAYSIFLIMMFCYSMLRTLNGDFDASRIRLPGSFEQRRNCLITAIFLAFVTYMFFRGLHG